MLGSLYSFYLFHFDFLSSSLYIFFLINTHLPHVGRSSSSVSSSSCPVFLRSFFLRISRPTAATSCLTSSPGPRPLPLRSLRGRLLFSLFFFFPNKSVTLPSFYFFLPSFSSSPSRDVLFFFDIRVFVLLVIVIGVAVVRIQFGSHIFSFFPLLLLSSSGVVFLALVSRAGRTLLTFFIYPHPHASPLFWISPSPFGAPSLSRFFSFLPGG